MRSFLRLAGTFSIVVTLIVAVSCKNETAPTADAFNVRRAPLAHEMRGVNGVMMQAFYWAVPEPTASDSWWKTIESKATELADAGITGVWLPPAYKGGGGIDDVGYGVYDRYDLGEFNQHNTTATRYGTLAQLQSAITALHDHHIQVYEDIVMNHMMGADGDEEFDFAGQHYKLPTHFTYPGRGTMYSNYQWHYWNFNGYQDGNRNWFNWQNGWDFSPYDNNDAYDNLMGCEIRYLNSDNRAELVRWGKWITDKLNLDGYRLDAVKHMHTPFVNEWLDGVKTQGRFAVSEAWFNNVQFMQDYAAATGGRTSLFDVPLHYLFGDVLNPDGPGDMRRLKFAGFTEVNGGLSVSFVENHDTDTDGPLHSPVVKLKPLAYAYILMRDKGYPCVFWKDYYDYGLGATIKQLIAIRKDHAWGPSREFDQTDEDVYIYSRAGDGIHSGLLLTLNDSGATTRTIPTPFISAMMHDAMGVALNTVLTDANGVGTFPIAAKSAEVWVPQ